ncbi:hypothetical protein J437_LFUL005843 [Ladona fulva]|uniref:Reverse transcriptase domain-containing protein n=1 Tax=Ladona fulva TaxID=123851 RepID=A0A8K0KG45_LADFU|nr:hypothetical protein J437_LFUL005843 [Ladona fulva]
MSELDKPVNILKELKQQIEELRASQSLCLDNDEGIEIAVAESTERIKGIRNFPEWVSSKLQEIVNHTKAPHRNIKLTHSNDDYFKFSELGKPRNIEYFWNYVDNLNCILDIYVPIRKPNISPDQHGFLEDRSAATNLLTSHTFVHSSVHSYCQVDVVYTDFSEAFRKVDHPQLLANRAWCRQYYRKGRRERDTDNVLDT